MSVITHENETLIFEKDKSRLRIIKLIEKPFGSYILTQEVGKRGLLKTKELYKGYSYEKAINKFHKAIEEAKDKGFIIRNKLRSEIEAKPDKLEKLEKINRKITLGEL